MKITPPSNTEAASPSRHSNVETCATALARQVRSMAPLLFAASLFAASTNANADTSVTVGWQGLTFSLQALDTIDGIAPWLHAISYTYALNGADVNPVSFDGPVPPDFRLPSAFETTPYANFYHPGPHQVRWDQTMSFNISPHTRLTVTGTLFADSSGPADQRDFYAYHTSGGGTASAALGNATASVSSNLGRNEQSFAFVVETSTDMSPVYTLDLNLSGDPYTSEMTVINVPEPATYALMLAGLVFVGTVASRVRSNSNAA